MFGEVFGAIEDVNEMQTRSLVEAGDGQEEESEISTRRRQRDSVSVNMCVCSGDKGGGCGKAGKETEEDKERMMHDELQWLKC